MRRFIGIPQVLGQTELCGADALPATSGQRAWFQRGTR